MTTHQTIKDLVNQKFDPISQKIDNLNNQVSENDDEYSSLISELIIQAIKNLKCSPHDINRGSCESVAQYVWDRGMDAELMSTKKLSLEFRKILPGHVWIYYNGKHYDAERPYGVNNFMDLPLFQYYKVLDEKGNLKYFEKRNYKSQIEEIESEEGY